MNPIAPPRGTKDLLPDQAPAWRWFHEKHAAIAEHHGYQLIDTPAFEATELFARGVGSRDRHRRQGDVDVHRPQGAVADTETRGDRARSSRGARRPSRPETATGALHYAMPMFRYDRPQGVRQREFHQVGVEVIGDATLLRRRGDRGGVAVHGRAAHRRCRPPAQLPRRHGGPDAVQGGAGRRTTRRCATSCATTAGAVSTSTRCACSTARRTPGMSTTRRCSVTTSATRVCAYFDAVMRHLDEAGISYTHNQRRCAGSITTRTPPSSPVPSRRRPERDRGGRALRRPRRRDRLRPNPGRRLRAGASSACSRSPPTQGVSPVSVPAGAAGHLHRGATPRRSRHATWHA